MGKKYKKSKLHSAVKKDSQGTSQAGGALGKSSDEITSLMEYYRQKGVTLVFSSPEEYSRDMREAVVDVAVDLWKIDQRLKMNENKIDPVVYQALRRPLESAILKLKQKGIEIKDYINKKYDTGMDENVLTTEVRPGCSFDLVSETIKPTIYYKKTIIGRGEIIVGVPPKSPGNTKTTGEEACAQPSTSE